MYILGISAYYHNSAAALVKEGKIIAAAEEERFSRKKNDPAFPENAIQYCLDEAGISLDDLDAIVFYDKPFLKFERLIETYLSYAPKGLGSFLRSIPTWIKEKIFLKDLLYKALFKIQKFDKKKVRLLFCEHHLSHAASAFYPSPYKEAAIVTMDGIGEWATTTISYGSSSNIKILKELHFPHSVGLLYSAFTYYCGFKVNSGEYKLMGLAPYGNRDSERVSRYIDIIKKELCSIYDDGSLFLNMAYFKFHTGSKMTNNKKWKQLFGFKRRETDSPIEQYHCDLAYAIQRVTEEIVLKLAKEAKRLTNAEYLCLAGGVALNCVANGKLEGEKIFKQIYIQPAAGDSGGALGAALAASHIFYNHERIQDPFGLDGMSGSYLGPQYTDFQVINELRKYHPTCKQFENEAELLSSVATLLAEGKVVGWYQGRMEFGPRALGARSILADPRDANMQRMLNLKVKFRESFRPFAPMILAEDAQEYFELEHPSPYMLLAKPVKPEHRFSFPEGYHSLSIDERLKFKKSTLSAATHVDYSSRIQTVHKETNARLWKLLHSFKQLTNCSALINTSFNVRGEPIVNTPEQAYECFIKTDIDILVIGNLMFSKTSQTKNP